LEEGVNFQNLQISNNNLIKKTNIMKIINPLIFLFTLSALLVSAQEVELNVENSSLKWSGKKITNSSHNGSIKFKSGKLNFSDGFIDSGKFIVDMMSINVEDLEGNSKARLEKHLRSDDFFSVVDFNESSLEITSSEKDGDGFKVYGILNIKGLTSAVELKMKKVGDDWSSSFTFDRSKHNVRYGSGSFFENLGDRLILDEISMEATLNFDSWKEVEFK